MGPPLEPPMESTESYEDDELEVGGGEDRSLLT